ncbi:hypothetical protein AJ78_00669 [Emergomyces pasteurianus Ep9510]|uniref:Uncharacterized protein n=1 Tax=Emergomyces pasteurianus Ep9510 TaxID=1447872 RepID=A0A1J9QT76_9EURO|nr:hypothetical protein AJ78_00669 [Emergomyces pasteurianus Ep9510]
MVKKDRFRSSIYDPAGTRLYDPWIGCKVDPGSYTSKDHLQNKNLKVKCRDKRLMAVSTRLTRTTSIAYSGNYQTQPSDARSEPERTFKALTGRLPAEF